MVDVNSRTSEPAAISIHMATKLHCRDATAIVKLINEYASSEYKAKCIFAHRPGDGQEAKLSAAQKGNNVVAISGQILTFRTLYCGRPR